MKLFQQRNTLIILTALLAAVLLVSCWGNKPGEFSEKELKWLVYSTGDTLIYTAEDESTTSLQAQSRTDLTQLRDFYPIEAEISLVNPLEDHELKIYLLKDKAGSFKRYIKIDEVYRPLDLLEPANEEIAGSNYKEVYTVQEDSSSLKDDVIFRVKYNKIEGIISFTLGSGKTYYLTETR